jgi:hypothetical protein
MERDKGGKKYSEEHEFGLELGNQILELREQYPVLDIYLSTGMMERLSNASYCACEMYFLHCERQPLGS